MIWTALLFACTPVRAIDGDTFVCSTGQHVRIWGVNAPEKGTAGARASTYALVAILKQGTLRCRKRGTSYERVVAQCFTRDGSDVSRLQLEGRYAVEWCRYSRGYYGTCRGW